MMRILEGLPDRFEVCYEASCGYGHYHDLLRPLAARVLVAHPGQSQDQSGDRNRLGHITREGAPVVRQLVAEAFWQAIRRSPSVRAFFERAQRGDPQRKKIALVATADY